MHPYLTVETLGGSLCYPYPALIAKRLKSGLSLLILTLRYLPAPLPQFSLVAVNPPLIAPKDLQAKEGTSAMSATNLDHWYWTVLKLASMLHDQRKEGQPFRTHLSVSIDQLM